MWPLFCCLSIPNIVGLVEAALSPTRRIIFVSHYPGILTAAAETLRFCVRVFEWSGLYVPVVHARHAKDMVQEPGPYILGFNAECRSLFTAPSDVSSACNNNAYVTYTDCLMIGPGCRPGPQLCLDVFSPNNPQFWPAKQNDPAAVSGASWRSANLGCSQPS